MSMTEESQDSDLEITTTSNHGNTQELSSDHDEDDYFYELLGAPMLLYRNRESYTQQDEDSAIWNHQKQGGNGRSVRTKYRNADENGRSIIDDTSTTTTAPPTTTSSSTHAVTTNAAALLAQYQSLLYRAQARWYYPMDYHLVPKHHHQTLPNGIKALCRKWSKQQQHQQQEESERWRLKESDVESIFTVNSDDIDIEDTTSGVDGEMDADDDDADISPPQSTPHPELPLQNNTPEQLPVENLNSINMDNDNDMEYMQVMEELQNALNRHHNGQQQQQQHIATEQQNASSDNENGIKTTDAEEMIVPQHNEALVTTASHNNATTIIDPKQLPPIHDRYMAVKQMFQSNEYNTLQMFQLQLQARAHMLLGNNVPQPPHNYHVRQILQAYTQLDTNYIPGQEKIKFNYTYDRTNKFKAGNVIRTNHKRKIGITRLLQQRTQLYDRERLNRSTPEYMAPFHLPSVRYAVAHDLQSRQLLPTKSVPTASKVVPAISHDDPNRPTLFGNCIVSFPCQCDVCCGCFNVTNETSQHSSNTQVPVPCLLHPVGPLQDRVRLSFLQLPFHRPIGGHCEPRRNIPEELDVGDRVRQLELCGHDPYVAIIRTDLHCTVITIAFVCPRREIPQQPNECWGTANLQQIHRIDCRTMRRSVPSFRPIHMTCHPNYGVQNFTPSKVAVVYTSSTTNLRNTIHHYQITDDHYTVQKFNVDNLQDITEIGFANHHPMILYCIGRSYVRPALTTSYIQKNRPRMGHGYALYSIDLRQRSTCGTDQSMTTCSAMYVWSPNIEEYTSEGIYSISGLRSDWNTHRIHYLWISSISAGKTYLIDTRLPCQCIHSFSLPYLCDQPGSYLPPTGLYGAGTLFSCPYHLSSQNGSVASSSSSRSATTGCLMLSVSKTPGAFGIHMYQIPTNRSRFQTQSIECVAGPNLSCLGSKLSLTKSSTIPLPDVSDKIFTCGLATIYIPIDNVCHQSYLSSLGIAKHNVHNIICIVSLTNKGDVYAHMLIQSNADKKYSKAFDGVPLGYSAIPVPMATKMSNQQWNTIPMDLTNSFPIPGHTIRSTETNCQSKMYSSTIDLSRFMEKDDVTKMKRKRKGRQHEDPEAVTSASFENDMPNEIKSVELPLDDVPRRAVVATSTDVVGPLSLTLPSLILPRQTSGENHTEHFLPVHRSEIENAVHQTEVCHSDLTPEILGDAWIERDW